MDHPRPLRLATFLFWLCIAASSLAHSRPTERSSTTASPGQLQPRGKGRTLGGRPHHLQARETVARPARAQIAPDAGLKARRQEPSRDDLRHARRLRPHGDDTTVPVMAAGKTDTGRCWVYVRDDKPFGGAGPPASMFYYSRFSSCLPRGTRALQIAVGAEARPRALPPRPPASS